MVRRAIGLLAVLALVGGFFLFNSYIYPAKQGEAGFQKGYKDATYMIDGAPFTLVNGVAETEAAPGSASKITTNYFGNEVEGDLNGDGVSDIAFLLTQSGGGSGTFYYVIAALKTDTGYEGTNAVLLGDRIAPQTTEYKDDGVIVNYAIRKAGEPMTTPPSVGVSKYFKMVNGELSEVALDFEGEADPSRMTLGMNTWRWISASADGQSVTPKKDVFTITFKEDNTFSATTDCNGVGGDYAEQNGSLTFSKMISTLMYCEGAQESDFTKLLADTDAYHFTSKGELIFETNSGGMMIFR